MTIFKGGKKIGGKKRIVPSVKSHGDLACLTVKLTVEAAEVTQKSNKTPDIIFRDQCQ